MLGRAVLFWLLKFPKSPFSFTCVYLWCIAFAVGPAILFSPTTFFAVRRKQRTRYINLSIGIENKAFFLFEKNNEKERLKKKEFLKAEFDHPIVTYMQ